MHNAADWEMVALCIELVSRGRQGLGRLIIIMAPTCGHLPLVTQQVSGTWAQIRHVKREALVGTSW